MTDSPIFAPGRTAVITGAASGIGLAAARRCAALGMNVVMADRQGPALEDAQVEAVDGTIERRVLDVTDHAALEDLAEETFARFGDVALLMNNAARPGGAGAFENYPAWRETMEVNFWGVANGVHAFTQKMIDQAKPARIVNTGSKQGITTPPGDLAYNVTKAAVKVLTEGLQHTLRNIPGCQVTAHLLVPGYTYTGMTARRVAEKPPGAWSPDQVIDYLVDALAGGDFYIICPDNETSAEVDAKRILWAAQDVAYGRPALSRWHPEFKDAFADYMAKSKS
jgi:NAD(P)-dependent dehydrogenase (short-subunit alcohol dehydrogenase family)